MADNWLESRYEKYLKKKAAWEKKNSHAAVRHPAPEGGVERENEQDT